MSKISLSPDVAGTGIFTIASPNSNTNRTLTLPDDTGTIVTNSGNQAGSFTTLNTSGQVVFNDAGADVDFRVEGDTNANLLFVDASADAVGVGTSTPAVRFHVVGPANSEYMRVGGSVRPLRFTSSAVGAANDAAHNIDVDSSAGHLSFSIGTNEAMRIDPSGNLLVGTTSAFSANGLVQVPVVDGAIGAWQSEASSTSSRIHMRFRNPNGIVGSISTNASATAFTTSSDYRLKENVASMTGALAKVLELKPCTYTWKADGSAGEGFIAHELQEVCPQAVTGEKDATEIQQVEVSPAVPATYDEEGNELTPAVEAVYEEREVPAYQGVDTSFLVATLTAAIQELKAELDAAKERIAALENA